MKKLILIVFTVLVSAGSFAQGIDVGIKAGANFSTLTDVPDVSTRTGFLIGGFVTLKFTEKMALQGDILYSQQGADGKNGYSDLALDYVIFPIVFKYYIINRLNIQAGPQFGSVIKDNYNNNLEGLQTIKIRPETIWNYSYYPVIFKDEDDLLNVKNALNAEHIFPRRYFFPSLNTLPYVDQLNCPIADAISPAILCLPLYHGLSYEDIKRICTIINAQL